MHTVALQLHTVYMRLARLLLLLLLPVVVCQSAWGQEMSVALMPSCEGIPGLAAELRYALSGRPYSVVDRTEYGKEKAKRYQAGCELANHLRADFGVRLAPLRNTPTIFVCDVATMTESHAPLPLKSSTDGNEETVAIVLVSLLDEATQPPGHTAPSPRSTTDSGPMDTHSAMGGVDREKPWNAPVSSSESRATLRRLNPAIALVGLGVTVAFTVVAIVFSNASDDTATVTTDGESAPADKNSRSYPALVYTSIAAAVVFGTATATVSIWFTDWSFGNRRNPPGSVTARRFETTFGLRCRF